VSDLQQEQAALEARGWEEFAALVGAIPRERWMEVGVLPGWSVRDLVRHVAGWMERCVDQLEQMRQGTFVDFDEDDDEVDARNAAFVAEAAAMDVEEVWSGLLAARELVRSGWDRLPVETVDTVAVDWFAGETYRHYEEHLDELRRFAG
jgi:hypothetical protein